mmetsp:Transcript_18181/g.37028  ORF Transcript_18181/g.37028 Transcript_18181/m.37028 type:complete len:247 (+) Transcript_18181:163-903(+)
MCAEERARACAFGPCTACVRKSAKGAKTLRSTASGALAAGAEAAADRMGGGDHMALFVGEPTIGPRRKVQRRREVQATVRTGQSLHGLLAQRGGVDFPPNSERVEGFALEPKHGVVDKREHEGIISDFHGGRVGDGLVGDCGVVVRGLAVHLDRPLAVRQAEVLTHVCGVRDGGVPFRYHGGQVDIDLVRGRHCQRQSAGLRDADVALRDAELQTLPRLARETAGYIGRHSKIPASCARHDLQIRV